MRNFGYCERCSKSIRLSEDVGLTVYVGVDGREFLCELSLIVPEAHANVFGLISWIHRQSWGERLLEAEIQGREDDAKEEVILDDVERLRRGEKWRKAASGR
jgi:hypothetical protein